MLTEGIRYLEATKAFTWREGGGVTSPDYYLRNPVKQPKREIGEYVERHGILVPRRFGSLDEAIASNRSFIVRSEHPQDYNGVSGIVDSLFVDPNDVELLRNELTGTMEQEPDNKKKRLLSLVGQISQSHFEHLLTDLSKLPIENHSFISGMPTEKFEADLSYSYWETVEGFNRTVVADSAVANRYHIFTYGNGSTEQGYEIIEDGKVSAGAVNRIPVTDDTSAKELVELYETIRALDRFDSKHCPLLEVQSSKDGNYFLQYHRGVDFAPPNFSLDRDPDPNEVEVALVRGATPQEGLELTLECNYLSSNRSTQDAGINYDDYRNNREFVEWHARGRKLEIVPIWNGNKFIALSSRDHSVTSTLFKPELSAVMHTDDSDRLLEGIRSTREIRNPLVNINVVSDGTRALIQRV